MLSVSFKGKKQRPKKGPLKVELPQLAEQKSRILIVDDHPILRSGLSQLINQEDDLVMCGEAEDAQEGMKRIEKLKPNVVIVDITLRGIDGIEMVKMIKGRYPQLPVLILSMHDESMYAERSLRAGARGYIMKQEAPNEIVGAIREVLKGEVHLSHRMSSRILSKVVAGSPYTAKSPVESLSDRELAVFNYIGQGLGTRDIASELCLSIKTVETYREHIKAKLRIKNSNELICQAVKWVEGESTR